MSVTAVPYAWPTDRRITVRDIQAATDQGEKWALLTSYDALTAGLFERAGVRMLLVGDTAGIMVYGFEDTVPVTVDHLAPLVRAVASATRTALVVADLPFGAYQANAEQALNASVRLMREGAQAVKLEGGARVAPQVEAIVAAGIPVVGHLGLTPQSVNTLGGMRRVQGRGADGDVLVNDALALERAGAFALVLESVPGDLGERVSDALTIPTVGVGGGHGCDAHGLVWTDMAGLTTGHIPRFVKKYADLATVLDEATRAFVADVADQTYPGTDHTYS